MSLPNPTKSLTCDACGIDEMVFSRGRDARLCDVCASAQAAESALMEELARTIEKWRVRRHLSRMEAYKLVDLLNGLNDDYIDGLFSGARGSATEWRESTPRQEEERV